VVHAQEVIANEDTPTRAIKSKKNSSMVVGFNLLKEKAGDAFVSAGNSGALLTGALMILGRMKGVDRPALGAVVPTQKGKCLIIDAGLNSKCKPINYVQFGIFGSAYMQELTGNDNPKVGLVNMGTEAKKGTEALKQANTMLSKSGLNFIGNAEGRDVPEGNVDVAVCDGYVGNVMLKFLEGAGSFFGAYIKNMFKRTVFSKLSMLFVMRDLKEFKKMVDPAENGGAPILGINGIVLKSHGNSNSETIKNVIIKASRLAESSMFERIRGGIEIAGVNVPQKRERKRWYLRKKELNISI